MNCQQAGAALHAYVDGQLDLAQTLEVERHVADCGACAAAHRGLLAVGAAVRGGLPYFRAPAGLEQRVRAALPRRPRAAHPRRAPARNWLAAAAAVAVVVAGAWLLLARMNDRPERLLAAEVTAAHVRSLMADHLWDVQSSDRHTVKPWFDGRLDFAPDVRDFKDASFALEGGRLDYLADRPVAALVYRHANHDLNLFLWPAAPGRPDSSPAVTYVRGYVLLHWARAGMNYWAVSDTDEATLRQFADLVRGHSASTTTATEPAPNGTTGGSG